MTNDYIKGYLTGEDGLLGVLSIPVGVYILYLLYKPTIMSLQKIRISWLEWYLLACNYWSNKKVQN